ncbi:MAG: serine/threonine protein kinase [Planctomycetota bacterium]|jgi:serine/threonine protein kinase
MAQQDEFDSAEDDTLVGTALEKYEILQKIGEGSIGTIYLGRDTASDEQVAIKFLTREISSKPHILARFKREIQTAIKMRHPNIVRGYSAGVWEGVIYYYVMEYVDGPTFQELISRQKVVEARAIKIAAQITSALQYIHEFGMVHRDLKPENIMINSEGLAKLADLGLAKDTNDISGLTLVGTIIGTPLYMSPEQAKGAAVIDIRSDIYSLGATLYHAVSGEPPFKGRTAPEVIAKQIEEIPSPLRDLNPNVTAGFEFVIKKMMEKDPAARYQDPRELVDDLQLLLEGKGDSHDPTLPWSQSPTRSEKEFKFSFYPGDEDFEYGLTAVANNLIERDKMAEILDFQEEMARHDVPLKIAHIALERGFIVEKANRKIQEAQSRQREMEASTGLGKMAIKKGMATQDQVQEALKVQSKLRKEGKIRLLGEILKNNRILDEDQVRKLLTLQLQVKFAKEDKDLLEMAKKHGLVSGPVADKVTLIQKNKLAMNRYHRIGDILVQRKFLDANGKDALLRALRRTQLTNEEVETLLREKMTEGEVERTEEIARDDAMLTKYKTFIDKQLIAGKGLRKKRKFREAIDAWRVVLEVLVKHPEAEKLIRDSENILEDMEAHQIQARKLVQMALREWEGVLKIDPAHPSAMKAMSSARDKLDALLERSGISPSRKTASPDATRINSSAPGDTGGTSQTDQGDSDEEQKLKRLLRSARRFDKQGNNKEARKRYVEILESDPSNDEALSALKTMDRKGLNTALLGCVTLLLAIVVAGAASWFVFGAETCTNWLLVVGKWVEGVLEAAKAG